MSYDIDASSNKWTVRFCSIHISLMNQEKDENLGNIVKFIQLKGLPHLQEIHFNRPIQQLLCQSVALQLKTMNLDVSFTKFAFENLIQYVELQLGDMLQILHKLSNIQRRNSISKQDLILLIKGINLTKESLQYEIERSKYVKRNLRNDSKNIDQQCEILKEKLFTPMDEDELLSSHNSEFFFRDVDILNLVPPTNKNTKHIPSWLPEFPPDHTYRFTALFNKPITDEKEMKRKLVEEAKLSEKALLKMLSKDDIKSVMINNLKVDEECVYNESQEESMLIFPLQKTTKDSPNSTCILTNSLNVSLKKFNVDKYAKSRIEIARRKVNEFDNHKLQLQRNPFIKATNICSPYGKNKQISRKSIEKELKNLLQRSYIGIVKSLPKLKHLKEKERRAAEDREKVRQEKLKEEREKNKSQPDVLDLNYLDNDMLLGGFDTTDEDGEGDFFASVTKQTPTTEQLPPSFESHQIFSDSDLCSNNPKNMEYHIYKSENILESNLSFSDPDPDLDSRIKP